MPIDLKAAIAPKAREAAYPALKASIVLFDFNPGTRSWTVPEGVSKIRAFVVGGGSPSAGAYQSGAGGGYSEKVIDVVPGQVLSYTVGAAGKYYSPAPYAPGGSSAFNGQLSASGGNATSPGVGNGGDINTAGAPGIVASGSWPDGGGAGHRFGNGMNSASFKYVDGWGLGLLPWQFGYGLSGGIGGACTSEVQVGGGGGTRYAAPGLVGIEVIA